MASSREERIQQRLRGAQRRQVKDVDFGFVVAAGPPPPPEIGASQPQLPAQIPSTTPAPPKRGRSPKADAPTTIHRSADANTSAKRRKLDTDEPSSRSTRSQKQKLDVYDIPPDEPELRQVDTTNESIEPPVEAQHDTSVAEQTAPLDSSILEAPVEQRPKIKNSRTPKIGGQPLAEVAVEQDPPQGTKRKRGRPSKASRISLEPKDTRPDSQDADEIDELSPEQPKRQVRSSDADEIDDLSPEQPRRQRNPKVFGKTTEKVSQDDTDDLAESMGDEEAANVLKRNRGKKAQTPRAGKHTIVEVETRPVERKKRRDRTQIASPAPQKQPKNAVERHRKATKTTRKTARGERVPVPVQRMTKGPVYEEDEVDADILNAPMPHTKRSGVNAVDVLRGLCHEMIGKVLDFLEEGAENATAGHVKREYRTKWRAIEGFGRELQLRLLEQTIKLDDTYALEKRVREAQKRKLALREEVLSVRAQREQLALRMDKVRIKHEGDMREAQERNALNTMAQDIEVAVERGRDSQPKKGAAGSEMSNSDLVLKRLADQVSVEGNSSGALKEIKEFNAFLERAALAMEGRTA